MPDPETAGLWQDAVLWEATGETDRYGQHVIGSAVQLQVVWNTKRREVLDAKGSTVKVDAVAVVDREIRAGSLMWLGSIDDLPGTSESVPDDDVMEVIGYSHTNDIRVRVVRRTVGLMRRRGGITTITE